MMDSLEGPVIKEGYGERESDIPPLSPEEPRVLPDTFPRPSRRGSILHQPDCAEG